MTSIGKDAGASAALMQVDLRALRAPLLFSVSPDEEHRYHSPMPSCGAFIVNAIVMKHTLSILISISSLSLPT